MALPRGPPRPHLDGLYLPAGSIRIRCKMQAAGPHSLYSGEETLQICTLGPGPLRAPRRSSPAVKLGHVNLRSWTGTTPSTQEDQSSSAFGSRDVEALGRHQPPRACEPPLWAQSLPCCAGRFVRASWTHPCSDRSWGRARTVLIPRTVPVPALGPSSSPLPSPLHTPTRGARRGWGHLVHARRCVVASASPAAPKSGPDRACSFFSLSAATWLWPIWPVVSFALGPQWQIATAHVAGPSSSRRRLMQPSVC